MAEQFCIDTSEGVIAPPQKRVRARAVWPVAGGDVVIEWPKNLSEEDQHDMEEFMYTLINMLRRNAGADGADYTRRDTV